MKVRQSCSYEARPVNPWLWLPIVAAAILLVIFERIFRARSVPGDAGIQPGLEFLRTFRFWGALTALPWLLPLFPTPFSLRLVAALMVPGLVMGALGATIMTLVVERGRTFSAVIVGFLVGLGVPLIVFWGLAALGPKNEATLGYGIFGFLFAVPSGIAGIIAGSWRGSMPPPAKFILPAQRNRPRPDASAIALLRAILKRLPWVQSARSAKNSGFRTARTSPN